MFDQNLIVGLVVLAVVVLAIYAYAPRLKSMLSGMGLEGFASSSGSGSGSGMANGNAVASGALPNAAATVQGFTTPGSAMSGAGKVAASGASVATFRSGPRSGTEGFSDYASFSGGDSMGPVPMAASQKPQGCYPREQLNPKELLPSDPHSQWAQVNPTGAGDIQGKNFLSAGALIGINTIGQSLRNANLQLRAEPPCPQVNVSPWMQSTIEPDLTRKALE